MALRRLSETVSSALTADVSPGLHPDPTLPPSLPPYSPVRPGQGRMESSSGDRGTHPSPGLPCVPGADLPMLPEEADGREPAVHDGARRLPLRPQPAAGRPIPAAGAPHPPRTPRHGAREPAVRSFHQSTRSQGGLPMPASQAIPGPCLARCCSMLGRDAEELPGGNSVLGGQGLACAPLSVVHFWGWYVESFLDICSFPNIRTPWPVPPCRLSRSATGMWSPFATSAASPTSGPWLMSGSSQSCCTISRCATTTSCPRCALVLCSCQACSSVHPPSCEARLPACKAGRRRRARL